MMNNCIPEPRRKVKRNLKNKEVWKNDREYSSELVNKVDPFNVVNLVLSSLNLV